MDSLASWAEPPGPPLSTEELSPRNEPGAMGHPPRIADGPVSSPSLTEDRKRHHLQDSVT